MTPFLAAIAAALILTGLFLGIYGICRTPVAPPAPARRKPGWVTRINRVSRRTKILATLGGVAGILVASLTGWLIAAVVLPLAAAGIPYLLSSPDAGNQIRRLEAMEEWTRSLAGVLTVGYGLEQALVTTLRSTPAAIRPEVAALTSRLHARWSTADALRAFADDLDDATGDLVAANLILAAQRRGTGLASVLEGLAESVAADVRARRAIEADREKPRSAARWITIITIAVLALLAFNNTYIEPYKSPLGQSILGALLATYVAILLWMRQMARGERLPRFIGRTVSERSRA